MKHTIVGLGEILWDVFPSGKRLGGAPANFAYHAQALGGRGVVASCVGADPLGAEILACVRDFSLETAYIAVDEAHPTGTVSVQVGAGGKPTYTIHEGVAWDFIPLTDGLVELAERADAICFGTLAQRSPVSCNTIRDLLDRSRPEALRIFDINLRQSFYSPQIVEESLQRANVLKLNDEELPLVADMLGIQGDEAALLAVLGERYNLRLVALTKGGEGSILYTEGETSHQPAYPIMREDGADTVGAGDSFTAALAVGLLAGHSLHAINSHANRVAAYVCSQPGATPVLPEELRLNL